jgi:hypothetical protein
MKYEVCSLAKSRAFVEDNLFYEASVIAYIII